MAITGHLAHGAAQVIHPTTGACIGYAHVTPNGNGQLQRWLLFENPHNAFAVHPPPEHMAGWQLDDWKANVPSLWRPGAYYIQAQTDVYRHGETHGGVAWAQIPANASLPQPTWPRTAGDFQLDGGGRPQVMNVSSTSSSTTFADDTSPQGLAYSVGGLNETHSVEYWLLHPAFVPAGVGGGHMSVGTGATKAESLQAFLDVANQRWGQGWTFAITACVNYQGASPPAYP